ncbi:DNA-3-methyladenine glycosylase [hydrothermal vent metagenome]|uniref:DNA-3-methyladenine glycosylase n=1 Tax=hydrothermal vent metagenome TaxID=652676 RepID=A0A3B0TRA2_9ZZZZ
MNKLNNNQRCAWAGNDPLYRAYHDHEWGRPTVDDKRLFEKICLEGFQSGLSWITILRKREHFRKVFAGFDFALVARFDENDVTRLLADPGIIRHRAKINATINNAARALDLVAEFGSLAAYFWAFEPKPQEIRAEITASVTNPVSITPESRALAKDLKKRGFEFVGPTTAYAFMQAMGLVNDHVKECFCHAEIKREREKFNRP